MHATLGVKRPRRLDHARQARVGAGVETRPDLAGVHRAGLPSWLRREAHGAWYCHRLPLPRLLRAPLGLARDVVAQQPLALLPASKASRKRLAGKLVQRAPSRLYLFPVGVVIRRGGQRGSGGAVALKHRATEQEHALVPVSGHKREQDVLAGAPDALRSPHSHLTSAPSRGDRHERRRARECLLRQRPGRSNVAVQRRLKRAAIATGPPPLLASVRDAAT